MKLPEDFRTLVWEKPPFVNQTMRIEEGDVMPDADLYVYSNTESTAQKLERKVKTLESEVVELRAEIENLKSLIQCAPTVRSHRGPGYWDEG